MLADRKAILEVAGDLEAQADHADRAANRMVALPGAVHALAADLRLKAVKLRKAVASDLQAP